MQTWREMHPGQISSYFFGFVVTYWAPGFEVFLPATQGTHEMVVIVK